MAEETDSRLSFKDKSQSHSAELATQVATASSPVRKFQDPDIQHHCHSHWLHNHFILITVQTSKIDAPPPAFEASD